MSFPTSSNFLNFWLHRKKNWATTPIFFPHPSKWREEDALEMSLVLKLEGVSHYVLEVHNTSFPSFCGRAIVPLQMSQADAEKAIQRQIWNSIRFSGRFRLVTPDKLTSKLLSSFTPLAEVVWLDKTTPLPDSPDGHRTSGWYTYRTYKAHQTARQVVARAPVYLDQKGNIDQLVHLDLKARGIPHQIWLGSSRSAVCYYGEPAPEALYTKSGEVSVVLEHPPLPLGSLL